MISYAQNFEDVLLRRALPEIERGFYIDVGAFHPVIDNVTQWFYSQGWSGINVEPNPRFQALLREQRPHDVNLPIAVSGQSGTIQLHLLDGLSTTVNEIAQRHATGGRVADDIILVDALSLDALFENYVHQITVDFLKIDVEGAEGNILEACAFSSTRPRLIVVEATEPDSVNESSVNWEANLLKKGYGFCYFDGLNRYYVREEDEWRKKLFDVQPNVFDSFLIPFTDRRVEYIKSMRSVIEQTPEGGIKPLVAERDGLREQVATLTYERDALAAQSASFAAERNVLAHLREEERDAFAREVADLIHAQTDERIYAARKTAELVRVQADERDAFARATAELVRAQADERDALARATAELVRAQADERDALAREKAELARTQADERASVAGQMAELVQLHTVERCASEGRIADLNDLAADRLSQIRELQQANHALLVEDNRLAAAYDVLLVEAARLRIKIDAMKNTVF